ncbi:hypothetical protein HZU77_003140 [Neisseriaceae bacterium TC5R-5]|nr:hypothetical protein [Neisseriaceae bacterium TC5R-5]
MGMQKPPTRRPRAELPSRLWTHIACAAATILFMIEGWRGTLDTEIWLIYLGIVGGFSAGSRLLNAWRNKNKP